MAAPRGNDFGKQFSADYLPQEKWTEEMALQIVNDLIIWLNPQYEKKTKEVDTGTKDDEGNPVMKTIEYEVDIHADNLFVLAFTVYYPGVTESTIEYLRKKYKSFSDLYKHAKRIQEAKLIDNGAKGNTNPAMTKFILANHHDYITDSQKVDHTTKGEKMTLNDAVGTIALKPIPQRNEEKST